MNLSKFGICNNWTHIVGDEVLFNRMGFYFFSAVLDYKTLNGIKIIHNWQKSMKIRKTNFSRLSDH
ncbi:hypothetical protein [Aestuariivivens insulae]|uniref:hypothetical protein n=1 Tax=Aestuariivivens insulae TaxID=1621988 RepID=UPI001F57217A|nr:hypothetical protein [Aestuariivivens insulae]